MTMPHLMNCSHSPDGWCLDCVKTEHEESQKSFGSWISVEERLPEQGIRVWASTGEDDVGHDCFIGHKSVTFQEIRETGKVDFGEVCWRYTETEKPIRLSCPIRFWMPLPSPPPLKVKRATIPDPDCYQCDGVGWYEGGKTIKTNCHCLRLCDEDVALKLVANGTTETWRRLYNDVNI